MNTPTFSEIGDLPVSLDLPTAGRMLRIGRTRAYTMARTGTFPTRVIPTGAGFVVPTAEVLRLLGIDAATGDPGTTDASQKPQITEASSPNNSDLT